MIIAIPVCAAYATYALKGYYHARGLLVPDIETEEGEEGSAPNAPEEDAVMQEIWSVDFTRMHLQAASERATQHIVEVISFIAL